MRDRVAIMMLGAGVLLGCERAEPPPETDADAADTAAETTAPDTRDVFVDEVPTGAQVLFVADQDTRPDGARANTTFVPMSTFSVERDGIPNEFPPADSMAGLLEEAGVGGGRLVIVGAPIPAGRAYAAMDYLGLGDRASILQRAPDTFNGDDGDDGATGPTGAGGAPGGTRAPGEDGTRGETGQAGTPRAPAALDTDVRDDMIVDAEWVRERLDDPGVAILDARPPAEYSGETPGDGIDRPGHVPGAVSVFWETLVESPDGPRLRSEPELRRIFLEAGAEPGDVVVAYCRTGGQASFLYAVARHLGYDVRLYDGSYVDWSRTDFPVERGEGGDGPGGSDSDGGGEGRGEGGGGDGGEGE